MASSPTDVAPDTRLAFGSYLRDQLQEKGYDLVWFSHLVGLSTNQMNRLLNGSGRLLPARIAIIARALGYNHQQTRDLFVRAGLPPGLCNVPYAVVGLSSGEISIRDPNGEMRRPLTEEAALVREEIKSIISQLNSLLARI